MPSRNIMKIDVPESYHHIYARGINRQPIFTEEADYLYFLSLFRRYLSEEDIRNDIGIAYTKLIDDIEVLAYCLMGNHFHLLVYQVEPGAMQRLMRGVMTAYSRYFNKKYERRGPLFESRYKASYISTNRYLMHISRYIHLNPDKWQTHPYTSLKLYAGGGSDWVRPHRILDLFPSQQAYTEFMADYKDRRDVLEDIKHELAGY